MISQNLAFWLVFHIARGANESLRAHTFSFSAKLSFTKIKSAKQENLNYGVFLVVMTRNEDNGLLVHFIMMLDIQGSVDRHIRSQRRF